MVSLRWSLLGLSFVARVLSLEFYWPTHPESGQQFSLRWTGGQAPYLVWVLTPDLQEYYYKYQGSDLITYWTFNLIVGTQIAFKCIDNTGAYVTSPTITVISTPSLSWPSAPQSGVSSSIRWGGGLAPYTVYVLTTDLQRYYWSYTGTSTEQYWNFNLNPGTQIVFQVQDNNGVKVKSNTITVQANAALVSESRVSVQSIASVNSVRQALSVQSVESIASVASVARIEASLSIASLASIASISGASVASLQQNTEAIASLSSLSVASTASVASQTMTSPPSGTSGTATSSYQTDIGQGGSAGSVTRTTSTSGISTSTPGGAAAKKSSSNTGAIAGGVVGGLLGLALIAGVSYMLYKKNHAAGNIIDDDAHDGTDPTNVEKGGDPSHAAGDNPFGPQYQAQAPLAQQPSYGGGYGGDSSPYSGSSGGQPLVGGSGVYGPGYGGGTNIAGAAPGGGGYDPSQGFGGAGQMAASGAIAGAGASAGAGAGYLGGHAAGAGVGQNGQYTNSSGPSAEQGSGSGYTGSAPNAGMSPTSASAPQATANHGGGFFGFLPLGARRRDTEQGESSNNSSPPSADWPSAAYGGHEPPPTLPMSVEQLSPVRNNSFPPNYGRGATGQQLVGGVPWYEADKNDPFRANDPVSPGPAGYVGGPGSGSGHEASLTSTGASRSGPPTWPDPRASYASDPPSLPDSGFESGSAQPKSDSGLFAMQPSFPAPATKGGWSGLPEVQEH